VNNGVSCLLPGGSFIAQQVPSVTGTWNGTLFAVGPSPSMSISVTAVLTEDTDTSHLAPPGALTGTITILGSGCPVDGSHSAGGNIIGNQINVGTSGGAGTSGAQGFFEVNSAGDTLTAVSVRGLPPFGISCGTGVTGAYAGTLTK
jgi:hypothetical protein